MKNKKKRTNSFKLMLYIAGVLILILAIGMGIYHLSNLSISADYEAKTLALNEQNKLDEITFNAQLQEEAARNAQSTGEEANPSSVQLYETTVDDTIWTVNDDREFGLDNASTITFDHQSLLHGGLMLVNSWHPLPSDYSTEGMVRVGVESKYKIQVTDNSVVLFRPAYEALLNMITAANEAGHDHYIVRESYRTNETQTTYFQNKMEALSNRYSGDILIEEAKKSVSYPGTSEYQTGMAFRLDLYKKGDSSVSSMYQTTPQGQWATENAWKYGIIFRYPSKNFPNASWEDKSHKTGIALKLNVYRYVGTPHSVAMKLLDYSFEEYVEFLQRYPHISIYEDGALRYEIVRFNAAQGQTSFALPVPNPATSHIASYDNMGGIVLAYTY